MTVWKEEQTARLPEFCQKPTLVLGCGNTLFGDDGFGCAVADYLERYYRIPDEVCVLDVGTSVRNLLFTLCLTPTRPKRIVLLDGVDLGRVPGELVEIDPADIPAVKQNDFSLHQFPTSNLLRELQQECGLEVRMLACQVSSLPEEVNPGLSEAVKRAVPIAAARIAAEYF